MSKWIVVGSYPVSGYDSLMPAERVCVGEVGLELKRTSEEGESRLVLLVLTHTVAHHTPGGDK